MELEVISKIRASHLCVTVIRQGVEVQRRNSERPPPPSRVSAHCVFPGRRRGQVSPTTHPRSGCHFLSSPTTPSEGCESIHTGEMLNHSDWTEDSSWGRPWRRNVLLPTKNTFWAHISLGVRATARRVHASKGDRGDGGVAASFYCLMLIVFSTRMQMKEGEMVGRWRGGRRDTAEIFQEQWRDKKKTM